MASKIKIQKQVTLVNYVILHILAKTNKCLEFNFYTTFSKDQLQNRGAINQWFNVLYFII